MKTLAYFVLFFLITTSISCGTKVMSSNGSKVNFRPNQVYKQTEIGYNGNLNQTMYFEVKDRMSSALQEEIPSEKTIIVHFNQNAPNCLGVNESPESFQKITENKMNWSSELCTRYNAVDYFVYTSNAFHNDYFKKNSVFKIDTGFFSEEVFTEHQNCAAVIIIKPNGSFHKYYGEDYFEDVSGFLNQFDNQ